MLQNADNTGENDGREMTELLRNLQKRKYSKDTCIEKSDTHEKVIVDSNANGSVSKKIKCAGKRRSFSFEEKVLIMRHLETESIVSVARKFSLNDRTLRKWTAKREEIEHAYEKEILQNLKKNRTIENENMGDALYKWFLQSREDGIPVCGTMLKNKALALNNELGGSPTFKASEGWLSGWKCRKKVRLPRIIGGRFPRDLEAWNEYKIDLANVVNDKQLTRAQVFDLDTTGLSYKTLPIKFINRNRKIQMSKLRNGRLRDRVTIGVCSNADGSLKLRLIVVGKSAHPRTIKNLNKDRLPVCYKNERNSLMDGVIFENWFRDEFVPQVKVFLKRRNLPMKALLIISNCTPCRHNFIKIGGIETMFLPPNITSIIHPEDETILETLKTNYKLRLVKSIFDAQENDIRLNNHLRTVTIKEMIFWIGMAWDEISPDTVYKLWTKLWPVKSEIYGMEAVNTKTRMLVPDSPVSIDSEETVISENNGTNEEVLDILRRIRGYESMNVNLLRNWITAVEDWENEKRFTRSKIRTPLRRANNEAMISNTIRNAEEEIPTEETDFTYYIL